MTHFEYELAFRAVIGLAGCAIALVAVAFDWRASRTYIVDFGDRPWREEAEDAIEAETAKGFATWTTSSSHTKGPQA